MKTRAERAARDHALDGGDHKHLEDEAMIFAGLFATEPVGKDLAGGLGLEFPCGGEAPSPAICGNQGKALAPT